MSPTPTVTKSDDGGKKVTPKPAYVARRHERWFAPDETAARDQERQPTVSAWRAAYELLSICARNSAIEPNRTVPLGSSASIDPSA